MLALASFSRAQGATDHLLHTLSDTAECPKENALNQGLEVDLERFWSEGVWSGIRIQNKGCGRGLDKGVPGDWSSFRD